MSKIIALNNAVAKISYVDADGEVQNSVNVPLPVGPVHVRKLADLFGVDYREIEFENCVVGGASRLPTYQRPPLETAANPNFRARSIEERQAEVFMNNLRAKMLADNEKQMAQLRKRLEQQQLGVSGSPDPVLEDETPEPEAAEAQAAE